MTLHKGFIHIHALFLDFILITIFNSKVQYVHINIAGGRVIINAPVVCPQIPDLLFCLEFVQIAISKSINRRGFENSPNARV